MQITNNAAENKSTASNIKRALKRLEITIPEMKPTKKFVAKDRPDLNELTVKEIRANRDPLKNEAIKTELLRRLLDQSVNSHISMDIADSKAVLEHYRSHGGKVLNEMQTRFDEAVEVLRAKHTQIGGGDLDSKGVDKHHVARAEATIALEKTKAVLDAWNALVPFFTGKSGSTIQPHLKFVDVSLAEQRQHVLHRGKTHDGGDLSVWDALNMGLTVSLTLDPTEVKRRAQGLEDEKARERTQAHREMRLG
ncbi:hypothetical protein BSP239C_03604 [Brevibacterium sp. 239c]|uniref:hypothetical protein n=1 Tax=Brevibacterium sp. 239c TaxID=1965356 RepID=UPI000C51CE30|nr:hypothetical protein [Brevibacterium sp. 239c]SMY03741.1 hypothetical protein BSP239C_03604 [Brevibacterium sp. 239c]